MECTRKITDSVYWVGGSDRRLSLFENLFPIPRGVSYNSYIIMDEKVALMDTVDSSITRQFLENIDGVLDGREVDYLVIHHMEPDHCANIEELVRKFPSMQIVANAKIVAMIKQFYCDIDIEGKTFLVNEGDSLSLGKHELTFTMAPMVHWPEVMMSYEAYDKILFSADAFGTFGALNGNIFNDEINFERDWLDDARRYYTNIVGKFGTQVQMVLKKARKLDIQIICPLHGPIWRTDIECFLDKYDGWSSYQPENKSVMIAYGTVYGHTENVANILATKLAKKGIKDIAMYDVSNTHVSTLIAESFRCSHIVLASSTYNMGIFPAMETFVNDMKSLLVQNRTVAIIENGTWATASGKLMKAKIEEMKDMRILDTTISIKSAITQEQLGSLDQLVDELLASGLQ